jgi:hypothetical protein
MSRTNRTILLAIIFLVVVAFLVVAVAPPV